MLTQRRQAGQPRGIALVTAVLTLVTIAALVAGTFFVGRIEQLTGNNTVWATQAAEAAEAGLAHAINTVAPATYQTMGLWTPTTPNEVVLPTVALGTTAAFTDTLRRLTPSVFLIRSTGRRKGSGTAVLAEASLAQLVRIAKPNIGANAAVTVADPVTFNGNSFFVSGMNSYPPGWGPSDCLAGSPDNASNADDQVGIRSSGSTGAGTSDMNNIEGFPAKTAPNDPTVNSETFRDFKDFTFASLLTQPGVKILPLTTPYNGIQPVLKADGTCDIGTLLNFGEPRRGTGTVSACQTYFATVYGTGEATKFAAGSRGQGMLLIDGDLELVGGFEWTGLILIRGKVKITGTGNKIFGALLTEGMSVDVAGSIGGNIEIRYSRCALENATNAAAFVRPLPRGWSQLY